MEVMKDMIHRTKHHIIIGMPIASIVVAILVIVAEVVAVVVIVMAIVQVISIAIVP